MKWLYVFLFTTAITLVWGKPKCNVTEEIIERPTCMDLSNPITCAAWKKHNWCYEQDVRRHCRKTCGLCE
ncbi:Hypothetical predicted protein, partial [Paramuricea clavata]